MLFGGERVRAQIHGGDAALCARGEHRRVRRLDAEHGDVDAVVVEDPRHAVRIAHVDADGVGPGRRSASRDQDPNAVASSQDVRELVADSAVAADDENGVRHRTSLTKAEL